MIIEVTCQTCNKLVDKMATERNLFTLQTIISVWCHGKYQELELSDAVASLAAYGSRRQDNVVGLRAFSKPVMIIIDRDRGDEDPNEPCQGPTCQM